MCFYHGDADWTASVFDSDTLTAAESVRCDECFRKIPVGAKYQHIYMQQYECCRVCDGDTRAETDDEYEGEDLSPCAEGACDYGEAYEHGICEDCQKLLDAVRRVEEEDGCRGDETQPGLGQLREAMWEADGAVAYIDRARADHPELAMSGYLDRMYYYTHEYDREFEEKWDDDDLVKVDEHGGEGG